MPLNHLIALSLTCAFAAAAQSPASGASQLTSMEATGTVGPYRVGLNYTLRQHLDVVSAHYFYATQLKDIPLNAVVNGQDVTLTGADGSTFHLRFVGNGSSGTAPLTFNTSVGLSGTWTQGSRTLPVTLRLDHSTENPGTRLYAQVTDQPDAAYETMVRRVKDAMLHGDVEEVARSTAFPLRVNGGPKPVMVRNASELKAQWSNIVTPQFLAKLRNDIPHEMFVHNGAVMLGDGELWFNDKGLMSISRVTQEK